MAGFFDSIYRLFGDEDEWDPTASNMEQVDIPNPDEEVPMGPPTREGITPRLIPPRARAYARPGFETYLEHIKTMPQESEYEPGTGRKILAAVVGGLTGLRDPAAGYAAAEKIVRTPYERALSDWQAKGKELGSLATEEGKYIGNISDENVERGKLGARYAELDAREEQIRKNYEVASRNAATNEARIEAQRARDKELAMIAAERNKIDRIRAGADVTQAGAAATRAGAYKNYTEGILSGKLPKPSDIDDTYNAEQDALVELMATDPLFHKFYKVVEDPKDPSSLNVVPIMPDEQGWSPEDAAIREALQAKIGIETQKRLGGLAAGGAPPLWRMRPNVLIPPDRRRTR